MESVIMTDNINQPNKQRNIVMVDIDQLNAGFDIIINYNRELAAIANKKDDNAFMKIVALFHECDGNNVEMLKKMINNSIVK